MVPTNLVPSVNLLPPRGGGGDDGADWGSGGGGGADAEPVVVWESK